MAGGFIDTATIRVIAGKGGNGAVAFHREKFIAAGGPDGGDGGRGGNIIVTVDDHMSTLMDFRYKRKYTAAAGMDGMGKRCTGRDGADTVIQLPRGTVIKDKATDTIIHDMSDGKPFVLAKGGRGGWGNKHFATPTRQVPNFAKPGLPGQDREVVLELKLLADVGLVGFPNVGKSTLLATVSNAHPKVANYHFTTLFPNLGVVYVRENESFIMADIPGLIEGAGEGAGLGHDFLRHVDRCRLLVHLVDASGSEGRDPVEDLDTINKELEVYSPDLATRPQIVVASKCDLITDDSDNLARLKARAEELGCEFFEISSAAHQGLQPLLDRIYVRLQELPPIIRFEADYVEPEPVYGTAEDITVDHVDDCWYLEGTWLERLVSHVNFTDNESRLYFDKHLRDSGVYDRLEEMGIKDGDTVALYGLEFSYQS